MQADPTLSIQLAPWLDRHTPLYRETITDSDGVTRRYAIYELDAPFPHQDAQISRIRR